MNEELQSLVERAMAAGRSREQILTVLKDNGLDDAGALAVDSYIKKKSPSALEESASQSDLRPSVSESLSSERVQLGLDEAAIKQQKKAIADAAAAQVYTAVAQTKGDLNKIQDKQAFANAYTTYRSLSDDPRATTLPQNPVTQTGEVNYAVVPTLKKGAIDYVNDLIRQDEERKARLGAKYTVPVLSEVAAGAESIIGGLLKFNEMITGQDSELANFFLDDAAERSRDALIDYGLTEEEISKGFLENIGEGNIGAGLTIFGSTLVQQVPQLAAVAATGGAAGLGLLGASAAGSGYAELQDRSDLSEGEKMLYGLGVGAAEYLAERLFLGDVNMLRKAFSKEAIEGMTKKELGDMLFGAVPKGVRSVMEEGTEELLTSVAQQTLAKVIAGEEFNPIEIAESAIYGGSAGGGVYLLSRGVGAIVDPENEVNIRKLRNDINKISEAEQQADLTDAEKEALLRRKEASKQKLDELKRKDDEIVAAMTDEDRVELGKIQSEINTISDNIKSAKTEEGKKQLRDELRLSIDKLIQLKSKYDSQEEVGVPSPVVEGEAVVEAQPIEGAGQEATPAGRVLQAREKLILESIGMDTTLQAVERGEEVEQSDVESTQERILQVIDDIDKSDIPAEAKQTYIQTLEDKFDELEYYDNKTITTTEQVTEEVPVGAPRAGSRTVVEPEVRRGKFRLFERLNNLEVATGEETEGQTSVVETQDDGSIDVVTYDKKTKQEVSRQPRVAENILGLEYVESILDENGNVTGVVMRPATGKGQDESPMRIRVVNRPELAMDIAIDARKKQIGDIPEVIWMQEYETVTREVTTKEKVPAKERPAAREKAPVAPATEVAVVEEAPTVEEEAVVEQEVKNRKGLSTEEVNEALSASERLAKRLGLGVIIVTHRTRKEYNNAMDELSKNGSVAEGVESGRFIPSRNEVHINLEDMNASVPFHEVFHAAFVNRFGKMGQKNREKIANDFYNGILNILRKGSESDNLLADAVESFVRSGNYTAKETPEEFLAQTAGFLSTSGDKISKSTMDKLIQWLNNFISKIAPGVKIVTQGDYIDFMNSFSGALFESSTEKSLDEIAEEGSYTPDEPAVMPDLSESASRFNEEKAPNWLKENIANLKSLAGRKIPFAVFYDNTRVGKSTLKNKVTGKESNRNLMGGFGYSQIEGVKFEDDGAKVSVLAFTNEDMAARKLSEYLRKEGDLIPVAMQNTQTGHLGNLDVVYEMFDDVEGVVSTAPALYAQQQTGKKSGPEFEAARKAAEDEILGAIKQSVVELAEKTEQNKKKTGPSDRVKAARSILPMLNDITTLADWRDKILLGEWDSFGTRGLFNAYMLQAKPSKETKSTREVHKILHGKYGVPTVKELADGITEESFNNAELGDVIKFVSPEKSPVIYTTDPVHKDLPKEGVQKKSDKMTYTLKYIGDQVDSHVSYPYILAGQNDGFAPSYIDITEIFPDLRGKVKKSQSFYAAGRRSLAAPVGELELTESSSRDVREEILDREQESRIDRAKRAATSFVWNPTQKKIRVFKERMTSQLSVEGREIKKLSKRMNALLSKADDETLGYVNDIMDGVMGPNAQRKLEAKPKGREIFTLANSMRNYIDSFANDFVNDPAFLSLPESIVETIIDNFGQYMRGSYRFWKDKNYKPTNEARREAIAYEYEIIRAKKIEQLVKKEGFNEEEAGEFFELFHDETLAEATTAIDDYITEIEKIRNGDDFKKMGIISPSSIKLPSDEFTRRKNLPQTIKNLLGQERDPLIRFVDTSIALSNIKYKGHMLYAISESLGGTNFIKNEATDAEVTSGEYRLVKDKFSPLNGRYVHKDVFEAITDPKIYEADNIWMQGYLSTLQLARKSKVIYNVPTWRKNLTGGWYTMVANGVVNPELVKDLYRRAQLFANGQTDPETEAWIKIMGDNGLIGQDVNANLIGFTNAMYSRTLTGNDQDYMTYMQRGRNLIKNFDTVVGQKYAAVDDYTKLIVFRTEVDSFAKKIYGKSYESLTAKQKETVHAEAAEFVKQNTPTFSRLPKWYASLAKVPAGDFLSFEFESLRSFTSNIYNGQQDLMKGMTDKSLTKEQKAEYIKAGTRRLVGSASIMGARMAITSVLAAAAMGDDDELTEDVKKNRPNWMEGHSIIPVGVTKDGIATVYDYSMEDPYGSFFDLATDPLSFPAYLTDLLQPNMGITFLMNLAENKDFYGRDITNSYDSKLTKGYKYTEHTLKSLIVPPFISSAYRDEQKRKEVEADKYSRLDAVGRFASRAVIRDYQYNIGVQFYYFTDKFRTKKEQYSDLTGASRENRLAELNEIKAMYQSIVNIGIKKGNYQMIADANKNVKRALKPLEEAYVLYGYELPEQK
jgi:hypothetical protein